MRKADKLRQYITRADPWLDQNRDNLHIAVRKGNVVASGVPGMSFEYRYYLDIAVLDYPGNIDVLSCIIIAWARVNQPDLIFNADRRTKEITFEAEILSNSCTDVLYSLPVSEVTIVTTDEAGKVTLTPRDEPDYSDLYGDTGGAWDIEFHGDLA